MKRPQLVWLSLLLATTIATFAIQTAISISDQLLSSASANGSVSAPAQVQAPAPPLQAVGQQRPRPVASKSSVSEQPATSSQSASSRPRSHPARPSNGRRKSAHHKQQPPAPTNFAHSPPAPSLEQHQSSQQQQSSTESDWTREQARLLTGYNNTPPLFLTSTRDFFVDVARFPLGYRLATMQAHDLEGDRIEYSLQPANLRDASPYFSINSTSGELRLAHKKFSSEQEPADHADGHEHDHDDHDDHDDARDEADEQASWPKNLHFLNVAANDGKYTTVVELQIHFVDSSPFGAGAPVHLTPEGSRRASEQIESIVRSKTLEFYDKLYSPSATQSLISTGGSNSTIVYPNFVNPSLVRPQEPAASQEWQELPVPSKTTGLPAPPSTGSIRAQSSAPRAGAYEPADNLLAASDVAHSQNLQPAQRGSLAELSHERPESIVGQQPMVMSLAIVVCASLVLALVLLMFIVPLSVRRLRKRLKNVEMRHEQLSQRASTGGSSTVCSRSTDGSSTEASGHLASLQFSLGYEDRSSRQCPVSGRSPICRQSSLDSAITNAATTAASTMRHHQHQHQYQHQYQHQHHPFGAAAEQPAPSSLLAGLNRVNNGSIANPVYLHQHAKALVGQLFGSGGAGVHHQHNQDTTMAPISAQPFQQQQQLRSQYLPPSVQAALPNLNGAQFKVSDSTNDVYSPIDDEFYSTINTETTMLPDSDVLPSHHQQHQPAPGQEFVGQLSGETGDTRAYFASQCAQPLDSRRETDSPGSIGSQSSTRSLARFLSLPARHCTGNNGDRHSVDDSSLDFGAFNSIKQQYAQQHVAPATGRLGCKTIARADQIEREQTRPNQWEIERHKLKFLEILDEGQFGLVWRCKLRLDSSSGLTGEWLTVAVKTLKSSAAKEEREREELLAEIEVMKLVCGHPNVVKILHCCTSDATSPLLGTSRPILLVMEHVELGKLQSYLEKSRANHTYATSSPQVYNNLQVPVLLLEDNQTSGGQSASHYQLSSRDLIKFIYHVAKGMEYISSQCIVHRDLASRNILVSSGRICKIGDFGMARQMQSASGIYERQSRNTKVPVRWMAPEVLLNNRFTTKSDVFSFGILMWEIVTLGSTPYRHLKTEQVIEAVARQGERPGKPEYCHSQLYKIMSTCWSHEPELRPTFRSLVKQLDELLLSANNYIELDQYPDHNYYNIPKAAAPYELL